MFPSSPKSDRNDSSSPTLSSRWVCPNDRILALRAKLDTGWSVRSHLQSSTPSGGQSSSSGFKSKKSPIGYQSLNRFGNEESINHGQRSPIDLDTLDQPRPSASLLSSSPTLTSIDSTTSSFLPNGSSFESRSINNQSANYGSLTNSVISEQEQEMILSVINRAQELEQLEKDRIE